MFWPVTDTKPAVERVHPPDALSRSPGQPDDAPAYRLLEADEVRRHVKENLASYKVPRDVEFVDELPRTATGKVLKRELRARG